MLLKFVILENSCWRSWSLWCFSWTLSLLLWLLEKVCWYGKAKWKLWNSRKGMGRNCYHYFFSLCVFLLMMCRIYILC